MGLPEAIWRHALINSAAEPEVRVVQVCRAWRTYRGWDSSLCSNCGDVEGSRVQAGDVDRMRLVCHRFRSGSLRMHRLLCHAFQSAHTILPFPFSALRFAAVERTDRIVFGNLAHQVSAGPIPDVLKKFHQASAIAFKVLAVLIAINWWIDQCRGRSFGTDVIRR